MYDPVYFVESADVPLCVVQAGELDTFITWAGHAAKVCTIWFVDESGQMISITKESNEPF